MSTPEIFVDYEWGDLREIFVGLPVQRYPDVAQAVLDLQISGIDMRKEYRRFYPTQKSAEKNWLSTTRVFLVSTRDLVS